MFTNIKDKLITNVNKLTLLSPTSNSQKTNENISVNLHVGAEILTHYQNSWSELHEINESNSKNASLLAEMINQLNENISNDHINISKIEGFLNKRPTINKSIENCLEHVKNLHDSFAMVEKELHNLEVIIEDLEFRKSKTDYISSAIAQRKKDLADKLAQSILDENLKQKKIAAERQQVFEEAFNNDIATYKTLGEIPKIETKVQPSALLEEIQLDLDEQDLEIFLNDE